MAKKRNYHQVSGSKTKKVHSKEDKKKDVKISFPKFEWGRNKKSKEKTDPRKIELGQIKGDSIAWHLAMLSPSPGDSEQLIILQKQGKTFQPIHYDDDGSDINIRTDEDEVEKIYVDSAPLSLVDIHTHPEWMTPSFNDVALFVEFDSIAESYLITSKKSEQGLHIIYSLQKRKNYRSLVGTDRREFRKEWDDTYKKAEEEIKRREDNDLKWFNDINLVKASAKDKQFAIGLKRIEMLGKRYGFEVEAYEKDPFIIMNRTAKTKHEVEHGLYSLDNNMDSINHSNLSAIEQKMVKSTRTPEDAKRKKREFNTALENRRKQLEADARRRAEERRRNK